MVHGAIMYICSMYYVLSTRFLFVILAFQNRRTRKFSLLFYLWTTVFNQVQQCSGQHVQLSPNRPGFESHWLQLILLFFPLKPFLFLRFSLSSQRNFPISFKPKVAIAKFSWKMQRKTWYYEKWVGRQASFSLR